MNGWWLQLQSCRASLSPMWMKCEQLETEPVFWSSSVPSTERHRDVIFSVGGVLRLSGGQTVAVRRERAERVHKVLHVWRRITWLTEPNLSGLVRVRVKGAVCSLMSRNKSSGRTNKLTWKEFRCVYMWRTPPPLQLHTVFWTWCSSENSSFTHWRDSNCVITSLILWMLRWLLL